MIKKWIAAAGCVLLLSGTALASDYTVNGGEKVSIPASYLYSRSINRLTDMPEPGSPYLNQPSDLFIDREGFLYVADTKNNRVLKLTAAGAFVKEYAVADGLPLNMPQGVFVTDSGELYIADTGNSRIVHFTAAGELIRSYGKPDSPFLADVQIYSPTRIAVSKNGGLYVLMGETIMDVDASGRFRGYLGQTKIGYSFTDWLLRIVASEEQKKSISKRLASSYINLTVDGNGAIYATSRDTAEGQIKKLNSVGSNVYRKTGGVSADSGGIANLMKGFFTGNVLSKPFRYGEVIDDKEPRFIDICADVHGIVTVLEQQSGKLYQYDQIGNLLAVFGGLGTHQGEFAIPASLSADSRGALYVLDSSYGNIQVFEPTDFIKTVQNATTAYYEGDYPQAAKLWEDVLRTDETYPLAHYGIASTQYKLENWKEAMEEFRYSNDRAEYSKAFAGYRYQWMKTHFAWVVGAVLLFAGALGFLLVWTSHKSRAVLRSFEYDRGMRMGLGSGLWLAVGMLYRPGRTIDSIKSGRGRLKAHAAALILLLVFAARLFFIYQVHYPLQDIELSEVNLVLEFFKNIVPVATWVGACYLISSQFSGESTLLENFICACYAMVPTIVVTVGAAGLSHVMDMQDKGMFALLVNGVLLWTVWLLVRSVKRLNDYGAGHTAGVCLVALFAVVLIWFVTLFGYALVVRLVQFVRDLLQEIQLAMY